MHVNFLMYNAELVGVHWMSCSGAVEVYGEGGLEMFFNSFPQGSARFTNVRAGAVDVRALVCIYDSCLVGDWIFVFGLPRAVLRVLVPLKCTWMPLPLHSLLNFSAVLLM